jgi:predicted glycosyltransferase
VDFVRVPGVIKLRNGEYTSLNLHMDIEETLALRSSIIEHTASIFDPDVFIVDKEPLGLRGEVEGALKVLKARGTHLVLGLRDVLDEPTQLITEWRRKKVAPALRQLYDEIWVYGLPQVHDPLAGLELAQAIRKKVVYTGYLRRTAPAAPASQMLPDMVKRPYILVTTGGGGDGEALVDWVLRAYESKAFIPYPALVVLGPFMQPERREEFLARVEKLRRVEAITFDAHLQHLLRGAVARQAGADRAAHAAADGAMDPRRPGAGARPRPHAGG